MLFIVFLLWLSFRPLRVPPSPAARYSTMLATLLVALFWSVRVVSSTRLSRIMMLRSMLSVSTPPTGDLFPFVADHDDPGSPTVICGDFNAVFESARDQCGFAPDVSPQYSSEALTSLFRESCVVDVWRHLHHYTSAFTWLSPDGNFSFRINLVGCPIPWLHHVRACDIIPCPYSAHVAVLFVCPIPLSQPLWMHRGIGFSIHPCLRSPLLSRRSRLSGCSGSPPPPFNFGGIVGRST